ncbi:helix-turn-helix domain-containing protein [Streptomyces monomycini]|uniref:helix-turn-helix domain-containing protein n=1 Tax=Streptomyces monomycini TaxID=371720 RepID=UPI0004AA895B|nr:helix-turn-helix domain-containing protein [Streptomyces monomycini]
MSVTPAVHAALIHAMDRLLAGEPQHSDGSLTVASLAREAGISRATAYRATEALEAFRQRVDERTSGPDVPATLRERIRELQGELREARRARHEEITDLRRSVDTLAQHVQVLTLDNERLRAEFAQQGTVTAFPGPIIQNPRRVEPA